MAITTLYTHHHALMSNVMLHLYWQAMICLALQTHTDCNRLLVTFVTYWSVKVRILWCKTHSYGENLTWWSLSVLFNLRCSFTTTVTTHQSWLFIDYLSATGNIDNLLVKGNWSGHSSLRGGLFFPSGILVNATRCPDIYPSCWIILVTYSEQPCVDLWSGLTSSTHLCKCAWLGHCMIIWPCCRFIILFLSLWWGFFSYMKHILCFFQKKKNKYTEHKMFIAMHIRSFAVLFLSMCHKSIQINIYSEWFSIATHSL